MRKEQLPELEAGPPGAAAAAGGVGGAHAPHDVGARRRQVLLGDEQLGAVRREPQLRRRQVRDRVVGVRDAAVARRRGRRGGVGVEHRVEVRCQRAVAHPRLAERRHRRAVPLRLEL